MLAVVFKILFYKTTTMLLIDSEEIVKTAFDNIYLIEVGVDEYSFSYVYDEDIMEVVETLKHLEVVKCGVDVERNRSSYIYLRSRNEGYTKVLFDAKLEYVWIDRSDSYSHFNSDLETHEISQVYKIIEKDDLLNIFDPIKPYKDNKVYEEAYIDGRVVEINNDKILIKEEKTWNTLYEKQEWLNYDGEYYEFTINIDLIKSNKFRIGEKIRIKCKNKTANNKKNIEIENIYYLNEILYIVDLNHGKTKHFEKNEILLAMKDFINTVGIDTGRKCSVWYMYSDDDEAISVYENIIKKQQPNYVFDLENNLIIHYKVLPSRAMEGDSLNDYSLKYGESILSGFGNFERSEIENIKIKSERGD